MTLKVKGRRKKLQENMNNFHHIPVLLDEVIENLNIKENGTYIDGTLGGAGHSKYILNKLSSGTLIGIDKDIDAIKISKKRLLEDTNSKAKVILIHDKYENIKDILYKLEIPKVDGILLDLGVSSYQLDVKERGFSYKEDGPLDMRMDQRQEKTAEIILNLYTEEELSNIIFEYGEERYSRKIAAEIVRVRQKSPIKTIRQLTDIIESVISFNKKEGNRSKRTFQALRIETNDELKNLGKTIEDGIKLLKDGGRMLVISFHSLEDRIIKQKFIELEGRCICPKDLPICSCNPISYGKIITKKIIAPSKKEIEQNRRSHSAKLRVFEKKG